ncbi:MAG: S1C family serine protease [Alphaproteobacteria bacterium]|nr:S1C family serine protease [Alphaproteobacteria bacterium]
MILTTNRRTAMTLAGLSLALAVFSSTPLPAKAQDAEPITDPRAAIVTVQTVVPGDARTARTLGQTRLGSGVIIDSSGLILTIGYIMMEASGITVTMADGRAEPARAVAYDHQSGFGLVRLLRPPEAVTPIRFGDSNDMDVEAYAVVFSGGMTGPTATPVQIVGRRSFAGYWEYLLEEAIFSSPPAPMFGGAAMLDAAGRLVGVGSLVVPDAAGPNSRTPGNMFVPINDLKPVLGELLESGRREADLAPWLGVITQEVQGHVVVLSASEDGPAAKAGIERGDVIAAVDGAGVDGMEDFLRKVRDLGPAGVTAPVTILRRGEGVIQRDVQTMDRSDWLRLNPTN